MPSRRQVLEQALVTEREALWVDLDRVLMDGRLQTGARVRSLVSRIRAAGFALGYPTDPEQVPVRCWRWYEMVETCHEIGLVAKRVDWEMSEVQQFGIDRGVRSFFAQRDNGRHIPEDPDDYDWTDS